MTVLAREGVGVPGGPGVPATGAARSDHTDATDGLDASGSPPSVVGYALFTLAGRDFAADLDGVREVVRLAALSRLPGMSPPLAGLLDLRGSTLPVLDVRERPGGDGGDVLVIEQPDGQVVGVAVDRVRAVVPPGGLLADPAGAAPGGVLPAYVVARMRDGDRPVLLVNLAALVAGLAPGSWWSAPTGGLHPVC